MINGTDIETIINTPKGQAVAILSTNTKVWEIYSTQNKKIGEIDTDNIHNTKYVECVETMLKNAQTI